MTSPPCPITHIPNGIGIQKSINNYNNNNTCTMNGIGIMIICRPPSSYLISPKAAIRSSFRSTHHHSCISSSAISSTNSVIVSDEQRHSTSTLPSRISPWLMLPPSFENDNNNMVYNFYSLKDDKVISINKRRDPNVVLNNDEPADDSILVGSSHGWLALYNPRNHDLFLTNPLTRRHIRLPPINQYLRHINKGCLIGRYSCVKSVILSSPPDERDCVAIMIYAAKHRLAFCYPGRLGDVIPKWAKKSWTPIATQHAYPHVSCVYSSKPKLFYNLGDDCSHLEVLDFVGLHQYSKYRRFTMTSPLYELDFLTKKKFEGSDYDVSYCLVVAEPSANSKLLLVARVTLSEMYPDGSSAKRHNRDHADGRHVRYPYKTTEFIVHKYDPERNEFTYMDDGSLDGLAIFIGNNHSFAIQANDDFPELKPDSIYFTDVRSSSPVLIDYNRDECNDFGGHDIGIYDYKNKTFSSCYYPCDVQSINRIEPAPIWFTPSPI